VKTNNYVIKLWLLLLSC